MTNTTKEELIIRIDDLRFKIEQYHQKLDLEAVWLFLATLACWSITEKWIQVLAIALVIVFFTFRVSAEKKAYEGSRTKLTELEREVESSSLSEDSKKARLYELEKINQELLSLSSFFKTTPRFLIGYAFWGISFTYMGMNLNA